MMVNMVAPDIGNIPILYGPRGDFIRLLQLSEGARKILEPMCVQLLREGGLEFFNNAVFELKWKPKSDKTSSDEEPPKKDDKPTNEEIATLRSIVESEMAPREWLAKLLIENRESLVKWIAAQTNSAITEQVDCFLQSAGVGLEKVL